MTPSIIACATCTPFGPNSRASDWAKALIANLPVAKEEQNAEPLMAAVADVKMRRGWILTGGRFEEEWETRLGEVECTLARMPCSQHPLTRP